MTALGNPLLPRDLMYRLALVLLRFAIRGLRDALAELDDVRAIAKSHGGADGMRAASCEMEVVLDADHQLREARHALLHHRRSARRGRVPSRSQWNQDAGGETSS